MALNFQFMSNNCTFVSVRITHGQDKDKFLWHYANLGQWSASFTIKRAVFEYYLSCATYDVLPSPESLNLWVGEDAACQLCSASVSLKHILVTCSTSVTRGRYTWRHNQVLKFPAPALADKRRTTNILLHISQATLLHCRGGNHQMPHNTIVLLF